MLANWLVGDAFKMVFFFAKDSGDVPWAFKLCGLFQAACDLFLGIQYFMFGDGEPVNQIIDDKRGTSWPVQNGVEMMEHGGAWGRPSDQKS